jgi:hypothetical protein
VPDYAVSCPEDLYDSVCVSLLRQLLVPVFSFFRIFNGKTLHKHLLSGCILDLQFSVTMAFGARPCGVD